MNIRKVVALLLLIPAVAQAEETIVSALGASTGVWEGELYYLDYQSGQRFGIPMRLEAELTPDGATLVRRLTYTDPGNLVYAVALVTVDPDNGELVEAYFREGRAELLRYEIEDVEFDDEQHWSITYEHDGIDDDRPARIRHVLKRNADAMTSSKEIRFLDEEGEFFLRNGIDLTLKTSSPTSG